MLGRHELLLRAALLEGEPALAAWARWKFRLLRSEGALDATSVRLLPPVYGNLERHGVEEPLMDRLREVYLSARSRNARMLDILSPVLRAFHAEGIPTLVLKGAALGVLVYRDIGLRPMNDVDVLVPPDRVRDAMALLRARGWRHEDATRPEVHIPYRHAANFWDPNGWQLDLHWHVLIECCRREVDEGFWDAAVQVKINDVRTRALCPAHQLLHVCVHGRGWRHQHPLTVWMPDALTVIKASGNELDWERLLQDAEKWRLTYPLRRALEELVDGFQAPVPAASLARLREIRTSAFERLEHRSATRARASRLLGNLPLLWFRFRRLRRPEREGPRGASSFADYLRYYWRLESTSQVPYRFLTQSVRRAARRRTRSAP